MHEVTPPSRYWVVKDSDGKTVMKFDTGGQDDPTPRDIPDDCSAVGYDTREEWEALGVDTDASPWYDEGQYVALRR